MSFVVVVDEKVTRQLCHEVNGNITNKVNFEGETNFRLPNSQNSANEL